LYNHQLPQSALKSSTPMQAMKDWYQTHPHLFHKRPYDRTGCDTYGQERLDIPLTARYVKTGENVTIGSANAAATFTISYQ